MATAWNVAPHVLNHPLKRCTFHPCLTSRVNCFRAARELRCQARDSSKEMGIVPLHTQTVQRAGHAAAVLALTLLSTAGGAQARLEGVNKPELLPKEFTTVIDVAGFLTPGEESRLKKEVESLERDTGVKLRVLAQNYPNTPGLAVKDYWNVDDDTVVFVADPSLGGQILNFNVGGNLDLRIPRNFWGRLGSKFGTKFYWQDKGEGSAIVNAVSAIDFCAREPISKLQCSRIQGELGDEPSAGPIDSILSKFGK